MKISTTVLGHPRIGRRRELKKAVEAYWTGGLDAAGLAEAAARIRRDTWTALADAGVELLPSNTFSLYDHVLDAAVAVDAVPARHRDLGLDALGTYFAMAHGTATTTPLELTKWFDTNYHHLVPELAPGTVFRAVPDKPLAEYREALVQGHDTRPVLVGPVTFLLLSKAAEDAPGGFAPLDLLDGLLDAYAGVLTALGAAGASWVQLDEPAFTADRSPAELAVLRTAYTRLSTLEGAPNILVTGSYGHLGEALDVLLGTPVHGIGVDLATDTADAERLAAHGPTGKLIAAGVIDGRNIWRADIAAAAALAARAGGDDLVVSTSCSLLHVPHDAEEETGLAPELRERLAFARQKAGEVVAVKRVLTGETPPAAIGPVPDAWRDERVRERVATASHEGRGPAEERRRIQAARLNLPPLATTTIGSFPQTPEIRAARATHRAGRISEAEYRDAMRGEIARVIGLQERLGLDVLVHGEAERDDMVRYFAERLGGFATTAHGWVQSYGTRCVRPPLLYGDVHRPAPMTVEWSAHAASLTEKPVKGMLTGPVTILAWSFVREDQPLAATAAQVALALREETVDLEAAGIGVIQVDEPALRELLPPRRDDHAAYLEWAVAAFRLATSGVRDETQVHTHLCYSEFGPVLPAIDALDADVTSIEASRSRLEILGELREGGYSRGVGPGVYDIHSPRVPDAAEIAAALRKAATAVDPRLLWVNPDCGLKTRRYAEVEPALAAMVAAAAEVRAELNL
ncbi:5-methyltetrahydropteroyltriglutamate--homocysteine methyltransferase [Actinorhabdospora filicis]|uniref:5-methyltetrahydropteroyltriglutamate--homocysteine methyltransferase n=1 Tax=Actinorhabdospora filicis TaxID=1785913 RepID=A0A9W6SP52_9ACTN|nr:5-methyltetrahydropteroyltriglutamate--homocysteine S-methyltransferase [Actinorhabdospora filicis]GLZ79558.1 5-methyltetrahydropteroyltriglutamate--homocysteine methyltransferase [Actinorhabdospora filicis]